MVKHEIIENKVKLLNNTLTRINNKDVSEIIDDPERMMDLSDLDNEIREVKFLKRGLFNNEKIQNEKRLLITSLQMN
jgi:hypothetical protein